MNQDCLEKVFIETFNDYSDAIFRFCLVKVSNIDLAEDMTQEVFTRYWQYLKNEKDMSNTRAFLYTIANNLAKDWYKKKKSSSLDQQMESGKVPVESKTNPEMEASYQEVIDVISTMETEDRELLLLKYVEGLPPKEIAILLGETANVISVRLNRATKRLQQNLHII